MRPKLSVLIKALNEEQRIGPCLDSVMRAIEGMDAEVVLVDSLSTDRTVEIARGYPIRIVQFAQIADRGCGAAVQLGYQESHGEFVYVLDADMQLAPDFLPLALKCLEEESGLAGVGGKLVDTRVLTMSDKRRVHAADSQLRDMDVPELGGGGLYRREAVECVGYLANRWLSAFEEADLGARLRAAGWRLRRLKSVAVTHEGHSESNVMMLRRLWRNGRAQATGAFLRAAWRQPWWRLAVHKQRHVLVVLLTHAVGAMLVIACWPFISSSKYVIALWFAPLLAAWLAQIAQKRSIAAANWALCFWHFYAAAAVVGGAKPLGNPRIPIQSREVVTSSP